MLFRSASRRCLDLLAKNEDLRVDWALYHLVGDHLRGESPLSGSFSGKVRRRLAGVPTVLAPRVAGEEEALAWLPLSAVASVLAVTVAAWAMLALNPPQAVQLVFDPKIAPSPALPQLVSMQDDVHREYLIAHQGVSPSVSLQGVGAYVRSVADAR